MAEETVMENVDTISEDDPIVVSTRHIPWLVPLCGGLMMFCLALVAVFMGAPS